MRLNKNEILASFLQELRRGSVVLCVLAKLKKSTYGYSLIETLSNTKIPIEANTLYPLLRRLESQEILKGTWNTETTKPRKYYELTAFGKEVLQSLKAQWQETTNTINDLLKENENETK